MFKSKPSEGRSGRRILIQRAELAGRRVADIRIVDGRIAAIGDLQSEPHEPVIMAGGALLLPGLHDHHLHVAALAAAQASVACGPPDVRDAAALAAALSAPGTGWLRGTGYHESVAGMIDRAFLDKVAPMRPVRVQHRSGRMWVFNSAGLDLLLASGVAPPAGLDRANGQLYDEDLWMRTALGGTPPAFDAVGTALARCGVTGISEMSPANDDAMAAHFVRERARGALPQRVVIAGRQDLGQAGFDPALVLGPVKLHLHEEHLPAYDKVVDAIRVAHRSGRVVAVHCVTEVELAFTLAAVREAGTIRGDRIEHASVTSDDALAEIAALGLTVVVQPHFVAERGDAYLSMIAPEQWPELYRLRAFTDAGVVMAGGSDAPFGKADPWAAMAAAVTRATPDGEVLGGAEALTPEAALALFLADPADLSRQRRVEVGAVADLCLLNRPWGEARACLSADLVRATFIDGKMIHDSVDQAPA